MSGHPPLDSKQICLLSQTSNRTVVPSSVALIKNKFTLKNKVVILKVSSSSCQLVSFTAYLSSPNPKFQTREITNNISIPIFSSNPKLFFLIITNLMIVNLFYCAALYPMNTCLSIPSSPCLSVYSLQVEAGGVTD